MNIAKSLFYDNEQDVKTVVIDRMKEILIKEFS